MSVLINCFTLISATGFEPVFEIIQMCVSAVKLQKMAAAASLPPGFVLPIGSHQTQNDENVMHMICRPTVLKTFILS